MGLRYRHSLCIKVTEIYSGTSQLRPPAALAPSGLNSEVVLFLKFGVHNRERKSYIDIYTILFYFIHDARIIQTN